MHKRWAALLGIGGAVGALALREAWQRRADAERFEAGRDFWRLSLTGEQARWVDEHLQNAHIPSPSAGIHLDIFSQPKPAAPVVMAVHGLMTYGRLFVPLAKAFFEQGYTVVCPDIGGNGFSGGVRGDMPVAQATEQMVDAALWVRQRFDGPLFLLGISLGGPVAYATASAGAPVSALACLDLFPFDDPDAMRQIVAQPGMLDWLPALKALSAIFGWVRVPTRWLAKIENAVPDDEQITIQPWLNDPLVPREISLRSLVSAVTTPMAVPLERNTTPTLVLNQANDRLLPPDVTRATFLRLGGPKQYVEFEHAPHWSFTPAFHGRLVRECDAWFRAHGAFAANPVPAYQRRDA